MKKIAFYGSRFLIGVLVLGAFSCVPKEKMKYISESGDDISIDYEKIREEKTIKPHDRLYIRVLSLDEKTNQIFRDESRMYGELNMKLNSYEVSDSGYIDFPFVGKIDVMNHTIPKAEDILEEEISMYLPNTSIDLKYAGNYITVLGEVRNPGNHLFFKERVNIFEALGHAGGITDHGNKQEVMVVRDSESKTHYQTVDITSKNLAKTYYYYLLPGDVIIVQPLNTKFREMRNFELEGIILSGVTTAISVLYFFTRN
jgi:polysaccharide export outer membrane protein